MNITFKEYQDNISASDYRGAEYNGTNTGVNKIYTWHEVNTVDFEYVESCYCNATKVMSYSGSK